MIDRGLASLRGWPRPSRWRCSPQRVSVHTSEDERRQRRRVSATIRAALNRRSVISTDGPVTLIVMDLSDLDEDPLRQFTVWYGEAEAAGIAQPDATALATVGADGRPAVRMVL